MSFNGREAAKLAGWFAGGALVGVGAGLLLAPQAGSDSRRTVVRYAKRAQIEAIRADISAANKAYGKLSDSAKKNRDTAKKLAEIATFHAGILKLCDEVDADARKTAREIKQALSSAYAASRQAASTQNILTEELDQPGHGAFSD